MQNITMTLTVDKWNIIFNALNQRPYGEVANLLNEMKAIGDAAIAEYTKSQSINQSDNQSS